MSTPLSEDKKTTAIEKRRETYQRKREREAQRKYDAERQIEALRAVRDNPNADPGDVLRAVELLNDLLPRY